MNNETMSNGEQQARNQIEHIQDMLREKDGHEDNREEIINSPLEVVVRDNSWKMAGSEPEEFSPDEYMILLCTGGPAVRIVGELDSHFNAINSSIEHQDWGTEWTRLKTSAEDDGILMEYVDFFYFGG